MKKHNIIVMASGNGSNFGAIQERCKHVRVQQMVTDQVGANVISRAGKYGIPALIIMQPKHMSREEYCEKLAYTLHKLNPELIVLAGFMKILTPNFFKKFHEKQIVNIHPSLLPKHKGVDTHKRVLEAKDEEHGITIHYVNEELDSGPIIWQSSYFIEPDDDETTLKHRGHDLEHKWYPFVIDQIVQGKM